MMRKGETKEQWNARMNEFMKAKYYRRRLEAIEYLGGECVDCHTKEMLEFDHKNPAEKSFAIAGKLNSMPWPRLAAELDKCELRCVACHSYMTACQRLQHVDVLGSLLDR